MTHVSWMDEFNSLTDKNCASLKGSGHNAFKDEGGMSSMGGAFKRDGMTLVFSFWDSSGGMGWLDSGNAGTCNPVDEKAEDI